LEYNKKIKNKTKGVFSPLHIRIEENKGEERELGMPPKKNLFMV
jgi:hypothetical protein